MSELHARFPCVRDSVGQARRAIVGFARGWFDPVALSDIESAAGEALANCAEHGASGGTIFEVHCRYVDGELSIEIKDDGWGFDDRDPRAETVPAPTAARGFGRYIMSRLMDHIEYSERGTCVRLIKRHGR